MILAVDQLEGIPHHERANCIQPTSPAPTQEEADRTLVATPVPTPVPTLKPTSVPTQKPSRRRRRRRRRRRKNRRRRSEPKSKPSMLSPAVSVRQADAFGTGEHVHVSNLHAQHLDNRQLLSNHVVGQKKFDQSMSTKCN